MKTFAGYCSNGLDLISYIELLKWAAYNAHPENKPYLSLLLIVTVIANTP